MKKFTSIIVLLLILSFSLSTFLVPQAKAAENSWTTKEPMPTARAALGVAVVNGRIYAIGGTGYLSINEEYDPATNTWTTNKKPMPTGRRIFAIAVCQNKIYVMGGSDGLLSITGVNEVYDPAMDTWETKAPMLTPRHSLEANVVNGKIYLIGGVRNPTTGELSSLNEVYDPATNTWTTKTSIPTAVYHYASAVVNNKIYVITQSRNQIYDPETDTWSTGTPPPHPYSLAAAGATTGVWAPKRIYVIGVLGDDQDANKTNQVYNPENDSWTVGASMPTTRFYFAVAVVKDKLYAIGGLPILFNVQPVYNAENEEYTPIGYGTIPIDSTMPTIAVLSPESKTYYTTDNTIDIPLNFTVNEPVSWMRYSLDGQANVTIAGNTTLTGLPYGLHKLTVYATDAAGNVGASETIYFTVAQHSEPFPTTWIVAAIVIIAAVGAALLVYFGKIKKTTRKAE